MYRTYIGIIDDQLEKVEKICADAKKTANAQGRDLQYEIIESSSPKYKKLLMIIGDIKTNKQWAGWFIHKVTMAKFPNDFWTKYECSVCGYTKLLRRTEVIDICPKCGGNRDGGDK